MNRFRRLLARRWWRSCCLMVIGLSASGLGYPEAGGPAEYQVKAAFILNFAKYVDWPAESFPSKESPLNLCIIGRDPFGTALGTIEGRTVHGRPLRIRRNVAAEDTGGCSIAYVSESEERRVPVVLKTIGTQPVLTLSDLDGFAEAGGAVGLFLAEERLQFDANFTALQRANLKASAQALRLARTVFGMKR
ncbi:MAG: YfiR family protein [Rhodocyclaceae bacterium]